VLFTSPHLTSPHLTSPGSPPFPPASLGRRAGSSRARPLVAFNPSNLNAPSSQRVPGPTSSRMPPPSSHLHHHNHQHHNHHHQLQQQQQQQGWGGYASGAAARAAVVARGPRGMVGPTAAQAWQPHHPNEQQQQQRQHQHHTGAVGMGAAAPSRLPHAPAGQQLQQQQQQQQRQQQQQQQRQQQQQSQQLQQPHFNPQSWLHGADGGLGAMGSPLNSPRVARALFNVRGWLGGGEMSNPSGSQQRPCSTGDWHGCGQLDCRRPATPLPLLKVHFRCLPAAGHVAPSAQVPCLPPCTNQTPHPRSNWRAGPFQLAIHVRDSGVPTGHTCTALRRAAKGRGSCPSAAAHHRPRGCARGSRLPVTAAGVGRGILSGGVHGCGASSLGRCWPGNATPHLAGQPLEPCEVAIVQHAILHWVYGCSGPGKQEQRLPHLLPSPGCPDPAPACPTDARRALALLLWMPRGQAGRSMRPRSPRAWRM